MKLYVLVPGWESPWGDSVGTKFVQQICWENDKIGPKNAELEDREPGGQDRKELINETTMTDKGCSRTRPGRPLADSSGVCQRVTLKGLKNHGIILRLTWARVDHMGLHFLVGCTRTFLENGWIPNREALAPLVQGVLVGIYLG